MFMRYRLQTRNGKRRHRTTTDQASLVGHPKIATAGAYKSCTLTQSPIPTVLTPMFLLLVIGSISLCELCFCWLWRSRGPWHARRP